MAKKIKKAPQSSMIQEPNPFAAAYAARLAKQVGQEFSTARQASSPRKTKPRRWEMSDGLPATGTECTAQRRAPRASHHTKSVMHTASNFRAPTIQNPCSADPRRSRPEQRTEDQQCIERQERTEDGFLRATSEDQGNGNAQQSGCA